jgi:hypothetical protein
MNISENPPPLLMYVPHQQQKINRPIVNYTIGPVLYVKFQYLFYDLDIYTMHLIHDLITAMQTDKSLLTPVAELSSQALKAKDTLILMMESLPQGPFLEFLENYVK